jgi:hypothetical protein
VWSFSFEGLRLLDLRPMNTFDASKLCKVHDGLNDCTFDWKPEWAQTIANMRSRTMSA